jgi:hypothetical protein
MIDEPPMDADIASITDGELRDLLAEGRAHADGRLVRLVTSYLTLRRVTADVVAAIEAREGGAAVAKNPLLLRARELSGGRSGTVPDQRAGA